MIHASYIARLEEAGKEVPQLIRTKVFLNVEDALRTYRQILGVAFKTKYGGAEDWTDTDGEFLVAEMYRVDHFLDEHLGIITGSDPDEEARKRYLAQYLKIAE